MNHIQKQNSRKQYNKASSVDCHIDVWIQYKVQNTDISSLTSLPVTNPFLVNSAESHELMFNGSSKQPSGTLHI